MLQRDRLHFRAHALGDLRLALRRGHGRVSSVVSELVRPALERVGVDPRVPPGCSRSGVLQILLSVPARRDVLVWGVRVGCGSVCSCGAMDRRPRVHRRGPGRRGLPWTSKCASAWVKLLILPHAAQESNAGEWEERRGRAAGASCRAGSPAVFSGINLPHTNLEASRGSAAIRGSRRRPAAALPFVGIAMLGSLFTMINQIRARVFSRETAWAG